MAGSGGLRTPNQRTAGSGYLKKKFKIKEPSDSSMWGEEKKNQNQRVAGWLFQRTVGFHERTDQESAVFRVVIWGHSEPAPTSTPSTGCRLLPVVDEPQPSY